MLNKDLRKSANPLCIHVCVSAVWNPNAPDHHSCFTPMTPQFLECPKPTPATRFVISMSPATGVQTERGIAPDE